MDAADTAPRPAPAPDGADGADGPALAALTTLRVGGTPARYLEATTSDRLIEAVDGADAAGEPVLVLGGGSNLLVADDPFPGLVVAVRTRGLEVVAEDDCSGATVRVAAGEPWDDVVAVAVERGCVGVEALSGIPGGTGATPLQNVGAYGQEVADTIATVRTWDRVQRRVCTVAAADADFGYRTSRFKTERITTGDGDAQVTGPRHVVLDVTFQLRRGDLSAPVRYAELARTLGVEVGGRAPLGAVREAVLGLRRGKGMVLEPGDHDTWSAGSFFTNPVLEEAAAAGLPGDLPRWPAGPGRVKVSAAALIERAGFGRGFGMPGPAALSTRHTLALTNRGGATAQDLLALARQVRDGVRQAFGVELVPEPVLVGCTL